MSEPHGEIEVFSAGCSLCHRVVSLVLSLAHESREVVVRDMRDPAVARRAGEFGIHSVPAVASTGDLPTAARGQVSMRRPCELQESGNPSDRSAVLRQQALGSRLERSATGTPSSCMSRDSQPIARALDFLYAALGPEADNLLDEAKVMHSQGAENATEHFRQGEDYPR